MICNNTEITMTAEEYQKLCKWVQDGNSPYSNGWDIATDEGVQMDYISAKRVVESEVPTVACLPTHKTILLYTLCNTNTIPSV